MAHKDALRWNARYAAEREIWLQKEPRPLLRHHAHLLPKDGGRALDGAGGGGANALFLAQCGLHVTVLDISFLGLKLGRARARRMGETIHPAVVDLTHIWLPANHFDVILNFFFLERTTLPAYRRALKPGGLIFFETFQRTGIEHAAYYLEPEELLTAF
ncbi:MAG: class I SAM-dependent methyltransferase, partial [Anaerolineales bacterium]